jgi:hypothetical protein
MILPLLQVLAIVITAICFHSIRATLRRRNLQSWEDIVSRLRLDSSTSRLGDRSVWNGDMNVTPEEKWQLIRGAHGLWAMYENAGVMLEMADYAARNGESVDRELLAALRSDAMQIRVCVLTALAKYACSQVNEGVSANVTRAASMYTEMAARTTELLQGNFGDMVPNLVPTM